MAQKMFNLYEWEGKNKKWKKRKELQAQEGEILSRWKSAALVEALRC